MAIQSLRQQVVGRAKLVVIKIGSDVLAGSGKGAGLYDRRVVQQLAESIAKLHSKQVKVVLVSSGAIGSGLAELGRSTRPKTMEQLQAAAAIGQPHLMRLYETALAKHGLKVGQILLTRSDFEDRVRYLNIQRTIEALHKMKAVPVINENDTVAVDEIRFGENDILAGLVVHLLRADLLIFLSSVDGLIKNGSVVDVVEEIDQSIYSLDHGRQSRGGAGGMSSKLQTVEMVSRAGEAAIIANGKADHVIDRLLAGEELGTLFLPAKKKMDARKRWIGSAAKTSGRLSVDAGAAQAIQKSRKSLLAIGVTAVEGNFQAGEVVEILGPDGKRIARGRVNHSSSRIKQIKGLKSIQIKKILGKSGREEVIHADDLAL
ncbi:MAG: glutamate 5-kinase [Actinobacteria bacterium]|nr:glutamate 5-kinase [Actinomycetota bacterium]